MLALDAKGQIECLYAIQEELEGARPENLLKLPDLVQWPFDSRPVEETENPAFGHGSFRHPSEGGPCGVLRCCQDPQTSASWFCRSFDFYPSVEGLDCDGLP